MVQTKPQQNEVLAHYREIAADYNRRANQTCERIYHRLIHRFMGKRGRLLELGGGGSELLDSIGSPTAVACDLSWEMLRTRPGGDRSHRVVAVAERLPFGAACFDGVFSVNVMEHVVDVESVLSESSRVLVDSGLWFALTPNGNWKKLLDLAESWSLKIPEGPHQFLTTRQLRAAVGRHFEVLEHRTILALPAGPPALSALVDRLSLCGAWGGGFFQYIVARKRPGNGLG